MEENPEAKVEDPQGKKILAAAEKKGGDAMGIKFLENWL